MEHFSRMFAPHNDMLNAGEFARANIPPFGNIVTWSNINSEGKVWAVQDELPSILSEPVGSRAMFIISIASEGVPSTINQGNTDLDRFAYDLAKTGDEIEDVFSTFNFSADELGSLTSFLFSRKNLPKFLETLNKNKFLPLDLAGKALISIFSDADEGIELLNIELDLPGSIEEKYQVISGIEEWILDDNEPLFEELMITHRLV